MASITVIIPCSRASEVLKEAIASVMTAPEIIKDIIVVLDSDELSTTEIQKLIPPDHGEAPNISILKRSEIRPGTKGAPVARNIGLDRTHTEFVVFLDDDDILCLDGLHDKLTSMTADPTLDFVTGTAQPFHNTPGDLSAQPYKIDYEVSHLTAFLSGSIPWMTSGPLWRVQSLRRLGGWNENLLRSQDVELHIRSLAAGLNYETKKSVAYHYRIGSSNQMSAPPNQSKAHKLGYRIQSYKAALDAVSKRPHSSPEEIAAAICQSIELAMQSRLAGGKFDVAVDGIVHLRKMGWLSLTEYLKICTALLLWLRVFGKIPSRRYLLRRYLPPNEPFIKRGEALLRKGLIRHDSYNGARA